jgi:magnesium-transporting ATPase (P-type)
VTHLVPETVPTLLAIAFDFPSALPALAIIAIDCGSEMPSAISFAWEPPEGDIMRHPPRDPKKSHLFTLNSLLYCIFAAGAIETIVCYTGWLLTYNYYSISSQQLVWSASNFWSPGSGPWMYNCQADGTCQLYDDAQQVEIANEAAGAYWFQLIMCQLMHLYMTKTRRVSLFEVGIFNNAVMMLASFTSLSMAMVFIWTPQANAVLVGTPFPGGIWSVFLIGWALLFVLCEGRKWAGRAHPTGFINKHLNW